MLHFAVIGDVHHVRAESHRETLAGRPKGVTEYADVIRNLELTRSYVPHILDEVRASQPQFIIQLGDLVQGHCDDQEGTDKEMCAAVAKMQALGIPCTFAVASHDGNQGSLGGCAVNTYMQPCIEAFLQKPVTTRYHAFVKENTLFVVMDYQSFRSGGEQEQWLDAILAAYANPTACGNPVKHILLFCHVPAVPVGRPFFSPLAYVQAIQARLEHYPIEAYFCGHTHNQVASLHRFGSHWSAHLKSSILGYPQRSVLLSDVRSILPQAHNEAFAYGWGYLEDSMPGWWDVRIDGDAVCVQWRVHNQGVQGELQWNSGEKPVFTHLPYSLSSYGSLPQLQDIEAVQLRVAGMGARAPVYDITLNGQAVGSIKTMEYFDVRQALPLKRQFWPLVRPENDVVIKTAVEPICLGGFVLEVQTRDNTVRSSVSPGLVTNSSRWDNWNEPSLVRIAPGEPVNMRLCFAK